MVRRALALGAGLIVLILIVLGVKGCLDARAHRALSDYARNVSQILQETEQTSKQFFGRLENPGTLSVSEFNNQVSAWSTTIDNDAARINALDTPGDMGSAQKALELVYELRSSAMDKIAKKMSTALGEAGAAKAQSVITRQMQTLFSSDTLYEQVARPEINGVLAANGVDGSDVPKSTFVPDGIKWLEEEHGDRRARRDQRHLRGDHRRHPRPRPGRRPASTAPNSRKASKRSSAPEKLSWSKSRSRTRANRPRTGSPSKSRPAAANRPAARSNRWRREKSTPRRSR